MVPFLLKLGPLFNILGSPCDCGTVLLLTLLVTGYRILISNLEAPPLQVGEKRTGENWIQKYCTVQSVCDTAGGEMSTGAFSVDCSEDFG